MSNTDIKQLIATLKDSNDIVDVIGRRVTLEKRGAEYIGLCPFHNDGKPSLNVNPKKQLFYCPVCADKKGDVFDFLLAYGLTFKDAVKELGGDSVHTTAPEKRIIAKRDKPEQWKQINPEGPAEFFTHYRHGAPSKVWAYHNADGSIRGYVVRFETPEGKEVLPYIYAQHEGRKEWRWQGFDKPRPLYNLHEINSRPKDTILVVEGEKTAEAAAKLLPHVVVTAWIGGSNAVTSTDWTPLHGRNVIFWPDHDITHEYRGTHPNAGTVKPFHEQPGNAAMLAISAELNGKTKVEKWINSPADKPCGWDLADATDWTPEYARQYAKDNLDIMPIVPAAPESVKTLPSPPIAAPAPKQELEPAPKTVVKKIVAPPIPDIPEEDTDLTNIERPYFKFLGYEKTDGGQLFVFFVKTSKIILKMSASGLSKNNLITLAPLNFWEANFRGTKGGFSLDQAVSWLISASNKLRIYSDKDVRGRGAWVDGDNVVIHDGDHLIIGRETYPLGSIQTKYVYEAAESMGFQTSEAMGVKEASQLIEACEMLSWERNISARLLAGWCVIAPICGALKWRPHIWITGPAGTGKTWVFQNIVRKVLGDTAVTVQGETSEAGLRQLLNQDALPVVFDEADVDDKASVDRVQKVLTLMRAASAEDGGLMAKGTAGGIAKTFRIRTCFAFASIGVQVHNQADRSRVSVLSLVKKDGDEGRKNFDKLLEFYDDVFTEGYTQRLQARTLLLAPIILKNAATFSMAAAAVIGDQRSGDQLGAMLAGAYSLRSSTEISYTKALEWIQAQDWTEEQGGGDMKDEHALFSKIMDTIVRIDGNLERSIGELITNIGRGEYVGGNGMPEAVAKLSRIGILIEGDNILISDTSGEIRKMLSGSAWEKNYNRVLLRLPGATPVVGIRFGSGIKTRAVAIPINYLLD